jgi:glyoxylase-like metal-dependent hydrolase (beta-lactamase superfamily II)
MPKQNSEGAKPADAKPRRDGEHKKDRGQRSAAGAGGHRAASQKGVARVRVYRHGLGDCILVRLRRRDGSDYTILIDCGVAMATSDAVSQMRKVVADIAVVTKGKIDVLAVTHQHWDHVSGFIDAGELFADLTIGELWLAWTEKEDDDLARELREDHDKALSALALCTQALGASEAAENILGVLGTPAAKGRRSTVAAFEKAKSLAPSANKVRCWLPQDDPVELDDPDVRIFALGPPHDRKAIYKTLPSKSDPETFQHALQGKGFFPLGVAQAVGIGEERQQPFSTLVTIPMETARGMTFFQNYYWGSPGAAEEWRQIDGAWLRAADDLALALQSATNNTSLVLAIELPDRDGVLLFAADAQVGNWLSWHDLSWTLESGDITGPELLAKTVFYKVGHHGSFNATLKEKGVDMMESLRTAVMTVDHDVALKMGWGDMPLDDLIEALEKKAPGRVFRTDRPPPIVHPDVNVEDLYFEFSI